nr:hypothetical protein [Tanacetum cinerariifolium]
MMKCGEFVELRQAFVDVVLAGIAKGMSEGLKHEALKNLKYPLVDQLEGLKDAPMDVIMASLHLESDIEDDALQWVCELRPSSFQLTIPVYLERRRKSVAWYAVHMGSAPHITPGPMSTVVPQGLAILLADAATQTETSDEASQLLRSSFLPVMYS